MAKRVTMLHQSTRKLCVGRGPINRSSVVAAYPLALRCFLWYDWAS